MTERQGRVDAHAHVIDFARFPIPGGPGYKPKPHEGGTRAQYLATLDRNGMTHGLLVQPSGYVYDNSALLDAIAAAPSRLKGIAVAAPDANDRLLDSLAAGGIVGLRFNLTDAVDTALAEAIAGGLIDRVAARGWFAQIHADGERWVDAAAMLRRTRVSVLIDHVGRPLLAGGVAQPGFQAMLAMADTGRAAIKLSGLFRVSAAPPPYRDLVPFLAAILERFTPERCVWGSDWPFLNMGRPVDYAQELDALRQFVPDEAARTKILWDTPARLFGFL